jgi:DNA polymerase I-like protein with 3'-5' exonuclease and polymerase domains
VNAVHDSILLEVPDKRISEASRLLQGVMEQAGDEILQEIPCLAAFKEGRCGFGSIFSRVASMGLRFFRHE